MRTAANESERVEPADEWLTVPQVAARMRCGRTTVFRLIGDGTLPSVKPGRSRLVKLEDVDTYLARLRDSTTD